ncbi:MAG: hypothetical protein NTZ87_02380 [Candidatus Nomurabacteria bacterium]|nr:hypothetical protein [Candidatus Nomurabacteria bacterium]
MEHKSENKICQNCKKDFTIEPDDFGFYEKIKVPPPTFCWQCRAIRRMAFRNMRHFFSRTCDATGAKIFTFIPQGDPKPVYSNDYWRSDKWNPLDYGRDYDFSRPFFEQMRDLYNALPYGIMWSMEMVNSDYSVSAFSKNCYLCFDSGYDEDSANNVTVLYSKQCFDGLNMKDCELCYYCLNTNQSFKTFFSRDCTSCVEVWFSQDCVGCINCFGCSGLRNKSYYIFNEAYDKESYKIKLAEMELDSWSGIKKAREFAENFWKKSPVKYQHSIRVTNSTGDYIYNGAELVNCFFVGNAKNMRHCQSVIYPPNIDGMDVTSSEGSELSYEIGSCGNGAYKCVAIIESVSVSEGSYLINCRNVSNVFGCVALRSKNYCILNKQYTKEEYEILVEKIKKHMDEMPYIDAKGRIYRFGEFFPFDMASHGYNQSQAFDYFPVTEKEAKEKGYRWMKPETRNYAITKKASDLPDSIEKVSDLILEEIIQCEHNELGKHPFECDVDCATAFRITKQELDFYRQMNIPLPRLCFNCRHIDRIKWRNSPVLYHRQCMCGSAGSPQVTGQHFHGTEKCTVEFETSYSLNRPEIVYCERCYQQEVY